MIDLRHGDMRDVLPTIEAESVHSVVTDPPYELAFMGRHWDQTGVAFQPDTWRAVLRVLKPGGYLLAMGGTRTFHRLACAIEDAGFEVRDTIAWVYGSGFPKSLDIGKAIDRQRDDRADILRVTTFLADAADRCGVSRAEVDAHMGTSDMGGWWLSRLKHRCQCPGWDQWVALKEMLRTTDEMDEEVWRLNGRKGKPGDDWAEREVLGYEKNWGSRPAIGPNGHVGEWSLTAPATDAARQWNGWGTALKPAMELICVARKPLSERTVAGNVLRHGTGGINVDACRVGIDEALPNYRTNGSGCVGSGGIYEGGYSNTPTVIENAHAQSVRHNALGRWPANLCHDGSPEVEAAFAAFGQAGSGSGEAKVSGGSGMAFFNGGVSKHNDGVRDFGDGGSPSRFFYSAKATSADRADSRHPTIKPVDLIRWLVKMVTPPNGTVLDPFAGSGTTGEAAMLEGFNAILIEREAEHAADIAHRQRRWHGGDLPLFAEAAD